MQLLLDNLASVALAGAVGLALVAVAIGQAEGTRDTTRFYGHQNTQAGFTSVLEFDLSNAGIGTPVGGTPVQEASATRLAFYAVVDHDGTTGLVEYLVTGNGTLDGVPVYSVDRYVDGANTGGTRSVSRFEVATLTSSGAAASVADAQQLQAEVEWVLPHAEAEAAQARQAVRRSAWSTTVRPLGLQP